MLTLQKAFGQLRLVVRAATESSALCSHSQSSALRMGDSQVALAVHKVLIRQCSQPFTTGMALSKAEDHAAPKSYEPPSPYKNPGPNRYGYSPGYFTGGLLPRVNDEKPIRSLPKYKPKDSWDKKHALFGQNDYIDILGDGSLTPIDMIKGPPWLIGFSGNELQRLARRLKFQGEKLAHWYPAKYHRIKKRVFFLYKKYNKRRGKRAGGQ